MVDWERVIEAVSTISNFVITVDEILVWGFKIDRRLGKGDRININNQQFRYNRGWEIGVGD